jgi:hypothetical protein
VQTAVQADRIAALLERAPQGTRFIFQKTSADKVEARAWVDAMRSLAGASV